jgi:glyoxylase-like metal-dependent hydrolase (beta-lactamase superfamily II)
VPEENLHVLTGGGETVLDGAYRVEYTPGHASHHVAYLHEDSGVAFVGDMAGVRIPPVDFTLAPTPPPDIDIEAWERSLDVISGWRPERLALTHFGPVDRAAEQLGAAREALLAQAAMIEDADQRSFVEALEQRVHARAAEVEEPLLQAAPPEHLFLGLERWSRKRG